MKVKSLNVEELTREMERDKTIVIQEVLQSQASRARQWVFRGERLTELREQEPEHAHFLRNADIFLVCEDDSTCQQYAQKIAEPGRNVRYLAGGHLAWNQFYHPVVVGFDEQVKVWQIHRLAKGYLSYMITSGEEALIVDPSYHIDYYLGLAHAQHADIQCVVDTQIHRDHVSGGARLAAKTGSPYYVVPHEKLHAEHQTLTENTDLSFGNVRIDVMTFTKVNGQAKKSLAFLINEKYLLSGNLPLQEKEAQINIRQHPSVQQTPDTVLILPSHAAHLGAINQHGIVGTTLGELGNISEGSSHNGQTISVTEPRAVQEKIFEINLTQKRITLDQANELEMGLSE